MRHLLIFFQIIAITFLTNAQSVDDISFLREKAENFSFEFPDSSIFYARVVLEHYKAKEDTLNFLDYQQYLAFYFYLEGKFLKGDSLTLENWDLVQKYLDPGIYKHKETYGFAAANRAYLLFSSEQYLESISLYKKAFSIIESLDSTGISDLVTFYKIAGVCYRRIGDHYQAIEFYKKAINLYSKLAEQNAFAFSNLYFDIGRAYTAKNDVDSAILYFDKSIAYLQNPNIPSEKVENNLILNNRGKAICFLQLNQADSAYIYGKKAWQLIDSKDDAELTSYTLAVFGRACVEVGRLKEGGNLIQRSRKLNDPSLYEYKYQTEIYNLESLAKLAQKANDSKLSIQYLYQILEINNPGINSSSLNSQDYSNPFEALNTIKNLSLSLRTLESPDSLSKALTWTDIGMKLGIKLRQSFQYEDSKLGIGKVIHSIVNNGLRVAHHIQNQEEKVPNFDIVFQYIESSKAILLYEALQKKEAQIRLPYEFQNKERRYKRDLAYYEKALFDEKRKTKSDNNKVKQLQESLFSTQQSYKRFQDTLELNFSSYYKHKYNLELANLEEVKGQLQANEAFLQFFAGDSSIFVMGIHPNMQVFERIPFTDSLLSSIRAYLEFLSSPDELSSEERGESYLYNAHNLYQTLLRPVLAQLPEEINRLIISPDGILSYIPFEALIESLPQEEWRYSDLPYLIHSHAISYTHSATHWLEQQEKSDQAPPNNWLGFAPSYEDAQITESVKPIALNRFLTRDGSVQLPYAQEEITQISQMVGGQGLFQSSALESDFHREADQYQILHLATHGLVEDRQPLYSKLVFAPEDDSVYDGFLHAYEIYNMRLPANLVVLSACNTGVGKLEKGEGIMSLSRAFFYAGVKSLLMSLWKVSDESTSELMVSFYEGLKAGKDKDLALQQAKVDYIWNQEIAMKSHPYFWAGFVLKGDKQAISLSNNNYWQWVLGGLLLLTFGLIFYRYTTHKKS